MVREEYITIPQLARLLGISRIAVYKKVKAGQIKAMRVGRIYVISNRDIAKILGKEISAKGKRQVDAAVKRTVLEYGEVLKRLAKD